jgi:hypothetical protein
VAKYLPHTRLEGNMKLSMLPSIVVEYGIQEAAADAYRGQPQDAHDNINRNPNRSPCSGYDI